MKTSEKNNDHRFKGFTDLSVWKMALNISERVFVISEHLPRKEDYGLTSQLRRSVNSIGANVAEGFGRKHKKDKCNFYIYSRGSAYETMHHLLYGQKVGYFAADDLSEIFKEINKLIHELNKLIKTVMKW